MAMDFLPSSYNLPLNSLRTNEIHGRIAKKADVTKEIWRFKYRGDDVRCDAQGTRLVLVYVTSFV